MNSCENCGLPEYAVDDPGFTIQIEVKAENRFQKDRKKTVWCHDEECTIQTLGMAKYGKATFKWPITLAQFRKIAKKIVKTSKTESKSN